jgi:hypothetical protein
MNWYRTLQGAWLLLRASQLWAPVPDNDPDGARACMRRFYALVGLSAPRGQRVGAGSRAAPFDETLVPPGRGLGTGPLWPV